MADFTMLDNFIFWRHTYKITLAKCIYRKALILVCLIVLNPTGSFIYAQSKDGTETKLSGGGIIRFAVTIRGVTYGDPPFFIDLEDSNGVVASYVQNSTAGLFEVAKNNIGEAAIATFDRDKKSRNEFHGIKALYTLIDLEIVKKENESTTDDVAGRESFSSDSAALPQSSLPPNEEMKRDAINIIITSGKNFKGEAADRNGSYPFGISVQSFDSVEYTFIGQIEWFTLGATHEIQGSFFETKLTFTETNIIIKGSAVLNCEYTIDLFNAGRLEGSYGCPSPAISDGKIWIDIPYTMQKTDNANEVKHSPVQITIRGYGIDYSDGSIGGFISDYPNMQMDDQEDRLSTANAKWSGNYTLSHENLLCLEINDLTTLSPPAHELGIGYTVTLENGTFDDGSRVKNFILYRFTWNPEKDKISECFEIFPEGSLNYK